MDLERSLAALEQDRRHGAGYLARKAVGILAAAPPGDREAIAARLVFVRPAMPAIAAAVRETLESGDPRAVLRRADAERRRIADRAASHLSGRVVATISNSSLVARALVRARPPAVLVAVEGATDEGHHLVRELLANGLAAQGLEVAAIDAEVAVVGCDAVFEDGSFVNRRGTSSLVGRMGSKPVFVLTERWKRVSGKAPSVWPEPDLFEIVAPAPNLRRL